MRAQENQPISAMSSIRSKDAFRIASLDLNLLVVLDALLTCRSVTLAARRVSLSQSATSHALRRLRTVLGDPLLVRGPKGMMPTPRALSIAATVRRCLSELELALAPREAFDASTATRSFSIAIDDYAACVVVPRLLEDLGRAAPSVDLRIVASSTESYDALEAGELDVLVAPRIEARANIVRTKLFDDRFVCMMRTGHPRLQSGRRLTLDDFVAMDHVLIAPRGRLGGFVDDALAKRGHERRVALVLAHYLLAPVVVSRSDLCLTVVERLAREACKTLPVQVVPPPLPLPGVRMWLAWHATSEHDPAHAWLRQTLLRQVRG
jgi:DNA-binding transcriptional LysR family regulator